ncbi:hypothetical protein ACE6H2_006424 [Prunus campanulata]
MESNRVEILTGFSKSDEEQKYEKTHEGYLFAHNHSEKDDARSHPRATNPTHDQTFSISPVASQMGYGSLVLEMDA